MRRNFPLVLAVFWVLALWLGVATTVLADGCASATRIQQALREVMLNGSLIDSAVVTIPDKLSRDWRREGIKIRYTIAVDDCGTAGEQTIWLPRVGGPYQFRVQDRAVLPVHPFIAPASHPDGLTSAQISTFNGRTSMMFRIPTGTTRVSVELQTMPYIPSGIALAELGPFAVMLPLQMQSYNEQSGGMTIISLSTGLIGIFAIALWRTRQVDQYIFWFGLMCLIWGVRGYFYASEVVNLPPLVFELINPFTVGLFAISCLQTTQLLLQRSTVKHNRLFVVAATTLVVSYAMSLVTGVGAAFAARCDLALGRRRCALTDESSC